jgi:cation diffusion facilitator family transporter
MSAPVITLAHERRMLLASIALTAVLSVIGVVWGWATGSRMILLDGVYGFVGVVVSWMMLQAANLADHDTSHEFPYGKEAATPLVIGMQGFILLATLVYAAVGAVQTIRQGGTQFDAGWAILYGVIATVASLAFWWWLHRQAGHSDLLRAEATAWRVSAFRGVGMVIGFSVMAALDGTSLDRWTAYIDPAMVLITCVVFIPAPLKMVRSTVRELLEAAPPRSVQQPVLAIVADVSNQFGLEPPTVRMTKVGPKLYVEVDGVVDPSVTVAQEHEVRQHLDDRLRKMLPYEVWLNLELVPRGAPPAVVDRSESTPATDPITGPVTDPR